MSGAFKNSGMLYVEISSRFSVTTLSTDADVFEWQMGIWDPGTTTNRPKHGAWLTSNTNLGNANVFLCNGTNSSYSFADTGIALTASTMARWSVRLTPSNSIAFYNGSPVVTNATSYPTATYLPASGIRLSRYLHTAAANRNMIVDNLKLKFRAGPGR